MLWKSQRVLALGILGIAMYCRGLLLQGMCLVSLSITILTMAWSPQVAADNGHDGDPRIVVIAIVVHIDATTHGISAGIPIPPIPDISATVGDHYTLGVFDLRALHLQ